MRDGAVLHESLLGLSDKGGPQHTTALLTEVERAADAAGGWTEVGSIAVGLGPGSFTGLRVGIATARGLGLSKGVAVRGACTLDALGLVIGEVAGDAGRLAVVDARRGEVFAALYSPSGERLWGPLVCSPEELARRLGEPSAPVLCAGSGAVRFREKLASRSLVVPDDTDPVHRVAARQICAVATTQEGGGESPAAIAPIYLRRPDAERWRERDTLKKP